MKRSVPSAEKKRELDAMWETILRDERKIFGPWWLRPYPQVLKWGKQLPKRGTILDIGCGMGNHTVALAKRGFKVVAFDASPEAVKQTKRWLKREKLAATVTCADFRAFDFGHNRFDGILSMNAIQHGTEVEVRDVVKSIYRSLKPGGMFLATLPPRKNLKSYRKIGCNTFTPLSGSEKGIPHVLFTKQLIDDIFSDFKRDPLERDHMELDHIDHFVVRGSKT